MKLLIVAMLLAVVQAPAPTSKQPTDKATVKNVPSAPTQTAPDTDIPNPSEAPKPEYKLTTRDSPTVVVMPPKKDLWDKSLVLVGIFTFLVILYQAVKTRDAAEATRASAEAAQQSLIILERQTAATETAANAARDNIELFINKERARLRVELEDLNLEPELDRVYVVNFRISIHGATAAFVTDTQCVAGYLPLEHMNDIEPVPFMHKITKIPDIISPNSEPIETFTIFFDGDAPIINEITQDRLFVFLRGFIKYKDVFDKNRETTFRFVWKYSSLTPMGASKRFGDWEKCGAIEDNRET
jgi:hypothetical protein